MIREIDKFHVSSTVCFCQKQFFDITRVKMKCTADVIPNWLQYTTDHFCWTKGFYHESRNGKSSNPNPHSLLQKVKKESSVLMPSCITGITYSMAYSEAYAWI